MSRIEAETVGAGNLPGEEAEETSGKNTTRAWNLARGETKAAEAWDFARTEAEST